MAATVPLIGSVSIRFVEPDDGDALARAYARNRDHLAPWDPERPETFYTAEGQRADVAAKLD